LKDKPKDMAKQKTGGKEDKVAAPRASAKANKKKVAEKMSAKSAAAKQVNAKRKAAGTKLLRQKKRPEAEPELDPFEIAKQTMKGSVPAIVETMVRKAKQGSCTHAKTLLEMTGAKHMFDGETEGQDIGEPWAKIVLERLDEAESVSEKESAGH
jgi:hypothetical protein